MKLTAQKTKKILVPGDPDGAYIVIRDLTREEVARIEGKYFQVTSTEVRMSNYAERAAEFARDCLIEWGNFFDESNMPLKFNARNVEKASSFVIEIDDEKKRFFEWINDEREKFADEVDNEEQVSSKN